MPTFRRILLVCMLLLLSACGGGDSDPPAVAPAISVQPQASPKVSGQALTLTVTATGSTPLHYQWQRDGAEIAGATGASYTIAALATADDGARINVKVSNGAGTVTSDTVTLAVTFLSKDDLVAPTPAVSFSAVRPASGDTVQLVVELANASAISVTPVGEGCGGLRAGSVAGARLATSAAVGDVGVCIVSADITTASGTATYTNEFTVTPRALSGQGLSFKNGVYFPSGAFAGTLANSTVISQVVIPQSLINGGTGIIYVDAANPALSTKAVFKISAVPGYFVANGVVEGGRIRFDLAVAPSFLKDGAATSQRTVSAQLVGADGTLSQPVLANATFLRVGSGPLQISLSFDHSDDVDLHVVTPGNEEIFYASRSDATGGQLDLDSNAGCRLDHVNNENIVWAADAQPRAGRYKVRVDLYESCSQAPVNYTLKVVNCGVVSTYTGSFVPANADFGGLGSGREVAQVDYAPCSGFSVAGRATYDDYPVALTGPATTATELPIRHATVEVRQLAGDTLLATTSTDENGDYSARFSMATPAKYYVKVIASQDNASVRQKVVNAAGALYAIRSAELDAAVTAQVVQADLRARRDASFAEAFNIFDLGVNAFKESASHVTLSLPVLTWQWTRGGATCGGLASCYRHSEAKIFVLSTVADEDAYDDAVLAHEFGHFFMQHLSAERLTGGEHSSSRRSPPQLAWSEGAATFFGQQVLRSPQYLDSNAVTTFALNLETLPAAVPVGTAGGALDGTLSEATVAAILWDIADNAQDSVAQGATTVKDVISNGDAVFATLLGMKGGTDRAAAGPELVDFLDIYLCKNYAVWEATAGSNFRGLITIINGFPYTTAGKPACQP
ncbi:hypothetical protein [Massilia sp. DWR3-1-1]|uniref:hypothetical protein n=1 Tax=Massilia sp. DWR3-1-1 TaxID=2804559 RepID=UPI003CEDB7CF